GPTGMSAGCLVFVWTSIVDTEPRLPMVPLLATKAVLPFGVTATTSGFGPTVMSVGFFVLVFTSIVDTVSLPGTGGPGKLKGVGAPLVTNAVLPSGVNAIEAGGGPTVMSVGFLVLVFTSMVDTVPLSLLATKAVLPSGVIVTPTGVMPTGMSVGSLVPVLTSI